MDGARVYLGLDVGDKRIGVAYGAAVGRVASPLRTVLADGHEAEAISRAMAEVGATDVVVGRPRNQSGEATIQTAHAEAFVARILLPLGVPVHWQDESVTSVVAEDRLKQSKKPYTKADIDKEAASIILQDFLERI